MHIEAQPQNQELYRFCQCLLYVCQSLRIKSPICSVNVSVLYICLNLRIKSSIGFVNVFSMYVRTLESRALQVLSISSLCMLEPQNQELDRFCQCLLYVCQNLRIKSSICSVNVFSMYVRTLESRALYVLSMSSLYMLEPQNQEIYMFCQCLLYVCQNLRIKSSIGSVNVFSMYVRTLESRALQVLLMSSLYMLEPQNQELYMF